ncbi:Virulence protein [Podosphaera aphanis]|nr:Virulence protein [Podosphaera aphanis]
MEQQQSQQAPGKVTGPKCRTLHIAHRRSPSELTPLMSMFSSPGMEQLAIQQQIDILQQQQHQIQATHQQYVNMSMVPPAQHQVQAGGYNSSQQQHMQTVPQQPSFQFPNQMQQPQMNPNMTAPTQQLAHRRNQPAVPNMGMGPPPAPSSGYSVSVSGYHDFGNQHRENNPGKGGRGCGPPGGGHQRRHSLALPEAKKAAEIAQQKRTNSVFQFPASGSVSSSETKTLDDQIGPTQTNFHTPAHSARGSRISHGRSQSVATGADLRRGPAVRGNNAFQFPLPTTQEANAGGQGNEFQRRGSYAGHNRSSSRNFESNWRNQPISSQPAHEQHNVNNFQGQQQPSNFPSGHRSRGSIGQSINATLNSFQFGGQPQLVQLPQGQMALVQQPIYPTQKLNQLQMNQLQALQAAQMSSHANHGGNQHSAQHQQRKTLFTPYLPQATLPALLGDGQLVSGILRVNKKNRSDAYVTTTDDLLDADIYICGSKDRNRALEGDLVAVELLDVDEVWGQKREKEEKKRRKDITDSRAGSISNSSSSHRDTSTNRDEQVGPGEGGLRRRGSLKQRPIQKKNDDVEVEGQSLLLVEEEEVTDEQKPLYAGHIVAVIERVPGQMFSGTLGLLRPSSQATKEKQEAERQARDGGAGRHHEQRQQDKPKIVWFKPTDKRVPLIAIPTEQAPRDFVEKHQEYADRIFVACIKRWPITSLHPFGTLVELLGKMGDLKVETDALLRDNNFAGDDFSDAVIRSVGLEDWSLDIEDKDEISARRDFRGEKIFTIDFHGANEYDNAIHVKKVSDGRLEIGVHISDVAHFIKANSLVDREAKRRGTAVYLINRSCAMLPPKIVSDVCSLIPGQDRLTVSLIFSIDAETSEISEENTWIGKGIINSSGKVTYKDIDSVLSGNQSSSLESSEIEGIQVLNALTQKWRKMRLNIDSEVAPLRLFHHLDDENTLVEQNIFISTPSHELIEELMYMTNSFVAQKIFHGLPEKALLRRHGQPNPRRLQTFVDRMSRIGYEIDANTGGSLQNSLFKVDDADIRMGMETLLVKAMHRAKYFISGKISPHLYPHYALNLPLYTHFTCPSRRYADIVVHRQLEAVLSNGKIEYTEDAENLVKTTESCNTKKDSAQNAQEQSIHIDSCRILDKKREEAGGKLVSEGIVLCVYESAFDVLIPEYGFEKRVHCDQLPLKKAEFRKNDRVLELYWEKGVPSSTFVPEDERPKASASQRSAEAAVRQAAVAERAKKEQDEAQRRQMETGTIPTGVEEALFEDDDTLSDIADNLAAVSIERPTQSVPPSPTRNSLAVSGTLHRARSDSIVQITEFSETTPTDKEKYSKFFTLREENGEYIQDVKEMMRLPVIMKTDLTKSPPCLTIRALNPYAL